MTGGGLGYAWHSEMVYDELGVNFQDQEIPEILEAMDCALIEVHLEN